MIDKSPYVRQTYLIIIASFGLAWNNGFLSLFHGPVEPKVLDYYVHYKVGGTLRPLSYAKVITIIIVRLTKLT